MRQGGIDLHDQNPADVLEPGWSHTAVGRANANLPGRCDLHTGHGQNRHALPYLLIAAIASAPYTLPCYLTHGRGDIPALIPAEAGTRFSDPPGGMQG